MKHILCLLLALGMAGPAWAEEPSQPLNIEPRFQTALADLWMEQRDCLAKMEAAGKAVDGHLAAAYLKAKGKYIGEPSFDGKDDFDGAMALWYKTKAECWQKTP
jgi:hypothetical protein